MDIEEKMKRLDAFAMAALTGIWAGGESSTMLVNAEHAYRQALFMEAEREKVLEKLKQEAGL